MRATTASVPANAERTTLGRFLRRLALILGGSYLGVMGVLLWFENSLVFHPTTDKQDWVPPPAPEVQDVVLPTQDGAIHAWWWPTPGARGAILYCHGNAGNLSHRGAAIGKIRDLLGESVLIFDYPGYGKSAGRPSEQGCYRSAEAAYDWLVDKQKIAADNIIIYGGSLGGGIAVDLASKRTHRALVLVKSFTSAPDVGQSIYPWLPVRWLMRNRFDSLSKIGKCRKPVFIAHGTADSLIPFELGKQLYEAANEPKMFFPINGDDHNSPLPAACFIQLRDFLKKH
ncbi:MAG: alpha/beta hydrolase [Planctomycetes bacterium]|nr:alpha/beta hydrolase [Planctomycetota bacterium]